MILLRMRRYKNIGNVFVFAGFPLTRRAKFIREVVTIIVVLVGRALTIVDIGNDRRVSSF